jgi:transcription antitermination factor NusG
MDIDQLQKLIDEMPPVPAEVEALFPRGEAVFIDGEFKGFGAVVFRVNQKSGTAIVKIRLFCRHPPFEIELSKLRPGNPEDIQ